MTTIVHAKSPLRLGLAGGGTDVSPYSERYGGLVLNATINLYTHCRIERTADLGVEFAALDFDSREHVPLDTSLSLGGPLPLHRAVYRRIMADYNNGCSIPLRVTTYSDVPPGSGIGSSSSLVVAMVQAYSELLQLPLGEYEVAQLAYRIERQDCAMAGGKQDQYAATFGGFNLMEFAEGDRVVVNPLHLKAEYMSEFEAHLLLYYTGRSRTSADIIRSQIVATANPDSQATQSLHAIKLAATEMKEALMRGQISNALDILGRSWQSKRAVAAGIANPFIDEVATAAMNAGARSLKISGAGGGGFLMVAADIPKRYEVIRALESLNGRFFNFTFSFDGVQSWKIL